MKKVYLIALICALAAGIATFMFAREVSNRAIGKSDKLQEVVVAIKDVPAGTKIEEDNVSKYFITKQVAVDDATLNSASNFKSITGKTVTENIYAGEQLNTSRFMKSDGSNGGVSYTLEEGMVAYSIEAKESTGVDGYIKPGDLVDIISIEQKTGKSVIALEGIKVMAVSISTAEEEGISGYESVTLEVSKGQAEELYEVEALAEGNKYKFGYKILLSPKIAEN